MIHYTTPWLCSVGPSIGWASFSFEYVIPRLWGALRLSIVEFFLQEATIYHKFSILTSFFGKTPSYSCLISIHSPILQFTGFTNKSTTCLFICWRILVIWASRRRIWNAPCMHSCLNKRKVAKFTICFILHESPLMHELTLYLIFNSCAPCFVYKTSSIPGLQVPWVFQTVGFRITSNTFIGLTICSFTKKRDLLGKRALTWIHWYDVVSGLALANVNFKTDYKHRLF